MLTGKEIQESRQRAIQAERRQVQLDRNTYREAAPLPPAPKRPQLGRNTRTGY